MNDQTIDFGAVDFTNCYREPIDIPGSIQPHGALLTLDPRDLHIIHAGGDTARFWGASAPEMLGAAAANVFLPRQQQRLRDLLGSGRSLRRPVHAFEMAAPGDEVTDAIAHLSGGLLILELEPRRMPIAANALALVQGMVRHVQRSDSLQALYQAIATEVRDVTGFDRVMVYRFAPDGSGAVIAEARGLGIDSFLGLNFPASDIPRQARVLYKSNWIRNIPDARYAPAVIVPPLNPLTGQPLDLSHSILRSVSPVHRQYLANMGVVASISLSLILRGQLWGLIACHHNAPRYLPYSLRDACELFAEMTSSYLNMKLIEADLESRLYKARIHEELVRQISLQADLSYGLIRNRPTLLLDLIPAAGVGLWVDGRLSAIGTTPAAAEVEALVNWLNATVDDGIFHTDCLPALWPPAGGFPDTASGLLALSVSRTPRDYVLWFRPELSQKVSWAGNPDKSADAGADRVILTPRNSFAQWRETVRLHSSPWLPVELAAAHRLRLSLLEVVLRRIDQNAREREATRQQREKMTIELDARLEELQATAEALKRESERRAVVETELSQVLRRTVSDQEAERLRIARELHDTLGQSLTLLQLGLEAIGRATATADFQQRLAALKNIAAECGREINRMAWEIRPTALDDLPIQTAIRNLLETWSERSAIQFDLHLTLHNQRLSPDIETTLYRVLQEALTNVVRHAGASRVGVVLGADDRLVTMIIDDDGRGFNTGGAGLDTAPAKRLGLLGIRERLALVNGSLEVESTHGGGTTLFIRVPS
jgi:two-component system, chemotaxis family, sensor kinase Cph1